MTQASIFRWRSGRGWLVLSGGGNYAQDETAEIDDAVLVRTISLSPLAIVWAATDIEQADDYLDYLSDLGGRTGYLTDIITEDDDSIRSQLSEAGIIILADGENIQRLHNGLKGAAMEGIIAAYEKGATVYAQGRAASLLATWATWDGLKPGFGWIENSIIVPEYDQSQTEQLKTWLQNLPDAFGVGLARGSAIALNPDGAVEVLGEPKVTVLLGKNLRGDS